jgi:hypothetical protein
VINQRCLCDDYSALFSSVIVIHSSPIEIKIEHRQTDQFDCHISQDQIWLQRVPLFDIQNAHFEGEDDSPYVFDIMYECEWISADAHRYEHYRINNEDNTLYDLIGFACFLE